MIFSPATLLQRLNALPSTDRYLVAFSGGLDSTVLLHALALLRPKLNADVVAVHVNHGLSPHADDWAQHCADFCSQRNIPLRSRQVRLERAPAESLEALARHERYEAIRSEMADGDAVLTAHQKDDQTETLLLLLLRGSGTRGLSGMPRVRVFGPGLLMRPLLDVDRQELEAYARREDLRWLEDLSNRETRFDRNYLRHAVIPVLRGRWPSVSTTVARSAELCAEAETLVREQAAADIVDARDGHCLSVKRLSLLSDARQRAALRLWLEEEGLPLPDHRRLVEIQRQMLEAKGDRIPKINWRGAEVYRYRGQLIAHKPLPGFDARAVLAWPEGTALTLPAELGELHRATSSVAGPIEIRFRGSGEIFRQGDIHKPLKKFFQEHAVPPWLRDRVPLIYAAGELVGVGDYVGRDRLRLRWDRGPGWPLRDRAGEK